MRLNTSRASAAALGLLAFLSPIAATAEDYGQIIKLPEDIHFGGLAQTAQVVILYGDPSKAGLYVERIRFPAGLEMQAHMHSDPHRTVLILSGTLYYAVGKEWDESKMKPLPPRNLLYRANGNAALRLGQGGRSRLTNIRDRSDRHLQTGASRNGLLAA
jgi:hypothetical protein